MRTRALVWALAALAAGTAFGQSVLQVSVSANGTTSNVAAGGGIALTGAGIGIPVLATVVVANPGASAVTISGVTVTGTAEITLPAAPAGGVNLNPGTSTSFAIQYLPASGNLVVAQVAISYTQNGQQGSFAFNVTGTSPRFTYSVTVNNGAVGALNNGDTITFPGTNVGTSIGAAVNISNAGSATGSLNSVTLTGAGFQIASSPAPAALAPGQQVSVSLTFAPVSTGAAQGLLTLSLSSGAVSFPLAGTGTVASLSATYVLANGNVQTLSSGSTIAFPPIDINATTGATVAITNQGTGPGTLTSVSLTGAAFQLNGLPSLPATIGAGQTLHFAIVFSPTQTGTFTGTFQINMTGASISGTLSGATAPSNISLTYTDPNTNNVVALSNNSTLAFPNTLTSSPTTVTLTATNSGAGTGSINSVSIGGGSAAEFQLLNLPSLPVSIAPNQQVRFAVKFSPSQQQAYAATLTVNINGQNTTVNLTGQGTGPQYVYTISSGATPATVVSGGTITINSTAVGQTTSVAISVMNAGAVSGQIAAISVTGQGLALANLPPFPVTLQPNASQQFTLNFTPTQPGPVTGQLTVGGDSFAISATGMGALLTYSYTNAAATTTVSSGGQVIFSPLAVGSSETLTFTVQNTGTSASAISSIGLAASSNVFTLQQLPSLPMNLAPNASASFTIGFTPNNTGVLTATLAINSAAFTLSGTGTQPAPLPAYAFQGAGGAAQPAQQPNVGLTLSSSYPLDIQGSLTLTFSSAVFTDDPSIEFANGSRTIAFTIPANSTQAVFSGGGASIALQTGTTAGSIVITPSFTIQGGFNITPSSPSTLTLAISRSAPQLQSATVSSVTATGFIVTLTGFSTTRVLTQFNVQITAAPGAALSTNQLTVNVSAPAAAWYASAASDAFGGSFLAAIPFTLQSGNSTANLVQLLQSLNITASNDVGVSNAISVTIQ